MSSLADIVRDSLNEQDENVDIILISLREQIVVSLINMLLKHEKCNRIVIPVSYTNGEIYNISDRIITTSVFGKSPRRCIFFGDFEGTHFITKSHQFDYFARVDREPIYRRYCKSVIMYNFIGTPPMNAYWVVDTEKTKVDEQTSMFFLKLSLWGKLCQDLQILVEPNQATVRLENVDVTIEWLEKLRTILRHFLPEILCTDEYTEELLSDENMICWVKGFVNETYNYIYNYNGLEFVGDGVFECSLRTFMYTKYPRLQSGEATNYRADYASRDYMSIWAADMQFIEMILADRDVFKHTVKTKGDLFEAFFACLFQTCTSIEPTLGFVACQNLMTMIGETLTFEKKISFGRDQHRVEQILGSFGFTQGKVYNGMLREGSDFGIGFFEEVNGIKAGTLGTKNQYKLIGAPRFLQFVANIAKTNQGFARILAPYEFSPFDVIQQDARSTLWVKIANIFQESGVDMEFVKLQKQMIPNFIDDMVMFDSTTAQLAKEKLSLITKKNIDEVSKLVQFKFNKDEGYVIMWIHTEVLIPESKLLSSLISFSGGSSKVSDDYYNPMTNFYQIRNLAVVPFPQVGEVINGHKLDTKMLGMYNALLKFTKE